MNTIIDINDDLRFLEEAEQDEHEEMLRHAGDLIHSGEALDRALTEDRYPLLGLNVAGYAHDVSRAYNLHRRSNQTLPLGEVMGRLLADTVTVYQRMGGVGHEHVDAARLKASPPELV